MEYKTHQCYVESHDELGHLSSWCMKFEGPEDFKEFQDAYSACLYEGNKCCELAKGEGELKLSSAG